MRRGSQSGRGIMHVHLTLPTRVEFDVSQPLLKVSTFGRRLPAKRARRKEVAGGAQQSSSGCSCPGLTLVTCRPNPPRQAEAGFGYSSQHTCGMTTSLLGESTTTDVMPVPTSFRFSGMP